MQFTGQHIVVTGASTGIGRATVVRLVAGGAKVTAIARRADLLEALCAELGDRAKWAAADVGDQAQLTKALDRAVELHGAIDGLFLNAGTGGTFAPLEAYSDENFASLMAVNMMGPFWTVRHVLPAMKAHGVPWLIRHLRGEIPLEEAAEGGKRDTRRYAKRQNTWFRNQLPDWPQCPAETGLAALEAQIGAISA